MISRFLIEYQEWSQIKLLSSGKRDAANIIEESTSSPSREILIPDDMQDINENLLSWLFANISKQKKSHERMFSFISSISSGIRKVGKVVSFKGKYNSYRHITSQIERRERMYGITERINTNMFL